MNAYVTVPPVDLEQIASASFLRRIEFHEELDSTNSQALRLAADKNCVCPFLVLAEHQLQGRGRGLHRWWSGPGALTFSVTVNAADYRLTLRSCSRVSLAAGLAVCEAIRAVLPSEEVRLKWPNDVYLQGRKISGILVEGVPAPVSRLVIGIGANVNNSLRTAPDELRRRAAALIDLTGRTVDRTELLQQILQRLADVLPRLDSPAFSLAQRWQPYCMLRGRTLRLQWGDRQFAGVCQGIDAAGALLVQTAAGLEACPAGVITHLD